MSHLFLHEKATDWASGSFDQTYIAPDSGAGLTLQSERGSFVSPSLFAPFTATEAIVSVNLRHADVEPIGLVASLSCSSDGENWSQWYRMLAWGAATDDDSQSAGSEGKVATDVLKLDKLKRHWRYRITWSDTGKRATVRRVAVNLYSVFEMDASAGSENRQAWGKKLNVPFLSQWDVKQHQANRVCSPTSMAMAAQFHGAELSPDQLASAAYDEIHDLFGNWPLNTLAISLHGLKAYVDRGTNMRFLEDRIASGLPTVASLAFGDNELAGAPIPKTDGHLVVLAGFDLSGNPVVRDPAARGTDVWLTYDRAEFARAWLGHGGVVYIVEPES